MGRLTEAFARANGQYGKTSYIDTGRTRGGSCKPLFKGPLEAGYDPSKLPPRMRLAGRQVQLIVSMTAAYKAGDRAAFDAQIPKFDKIAKKLDYDPADPDCDDDWGLMLRQHLFPKWSPAEYE